MKKIKVRIKKMPTMGMGGFLPMHQDGEDTSLPSLAAPGYVERPAVVVPGRVPSRDSIPVMAPPTMDSLAVDSTGFASDSAVVTKTPQGKVKVKAPAPKVPVVDNSYQTPGWLPYGLGAGALYGAYRLGKGSTNKGLTMTANPNAIIPPYNPKNVLQLPSREMKAKGIIDAIKYRKAYTVDELRELRAMGVTEASIRDVMSTTSKASPEVARQMEEAARLAAAESQGLWNSVKSGYKAFRAMPISKLFRKDMGGYPDMYQQGGDPDSTFENVMEFLDPSGVTSYDDVYRKFQDPEAAWYDKGLAVAGALPIVGKFGKAAKAAGELSKFRKALNVAGKVITPVAQFDRISPVSKAVGNFTGKAVQNSSKPAQWLANFGSLSNQNARFFNGADMLLGQEFGGEMAYGGQIGWNLDLNSRRNYSESRPGSTDSVSRRLDSVDPEDATYEAERDEVIVGDMDKDGGNEMLVFGGKRHTQGGTPANQQGFIFSDTKNLRLKGPVIEQFGRTPNKKGYTPAQLAKQYDLNKYKAVLDDKDADSLSQRTAALMKENYERKLGKLALVQESMKGFPQGIPEIAAEQAGKLQGGEEQMRWGGYPKMQNAGTTPTPKVPDWYKFFTKANTEKGKISRTGQVTTYDPGTGNEVYDDLNYWQKDAGRDFSSAKDMQNHVFNVLRKSNPEDVKEMLKVYGYPNADHLVDGYLGARSAKLFRMRPKDKSVPATTTTAATKTEQAVKPGIDDYQMQTGEDPNYVGPGERLPYNRIDMANIIGAISSPVKMYAPRMFKPNLQQVQGVYDQPDYNPLLASANTRAQMNQTFGNIGAAIAANTYNPELMQGLIQETGRARGNNLQMANQIAGQNNQIRNQQEIMNAQLMQDNYDKWVKSQEEYDIAQKLKWRKDVMPAIQQAENQRILMERYNAENPQYDVVGSDWHIDFTKGKRKGDKVTSSGAFGFDQYLAANPQLAAVYNKTTTTDDAKLKIYQMYQTQLNQRMQMFGRNPRNITGNVANPYFPQVVGPQLPD